MVTYVVYINKVNGMIIRLQCSRVLIALLKKSAISPLELSRALFLAKLAAKVRVAWYIECKDFQLWTDSMIVLGRSCNSSCLKTFVGKGVD